MAESNSPRLGLHRYSAGGDTFSRLEWESTMAALEAGAAKFSSGTARPTHDATHVGEVFYDTDDSVVEYGLPAGTTNPWLRLDLPAGVYFPYAGATLPRGYDWCDGGLLNDADQPRLRAAIGTTYNVGGEAAGTFRKPDMLGRVPVGRDAAQTEFDVLGEAGGSKVSALPQHSHGGGTGLQSADHSHSGSTAGVGDHTHAYSEPTATPATVQVTGGGAAVSDDTFHGVVTNGGGAHAHTFGTGGASVNHNHAISPDGVASPSNLAPYRVCNFIIKL